MAEKKNIYEADVIALPPLRLVLGDVPSPDPEVRRKARADQKSERDLELNVRKLIAHLTENEK